MKKMVLIFLLSLISLSVYAKDASKINPNINPEVQLQDNGWVKIVDQYVEEIEPEEFYKNSEEMLKSHKQSVKMGYATEKIRMLRVKIQFLKPCKATTKMEEWIKEHRKTDDPEERLRLTGLEGECIKLFIESTEASERGEEEKSYAISKKVVKQCPNYMEYIVPRFKCNYRLKVFRTSFYSPTKYKEFNSSTFSFFPDAPTIEVRNGRIFRKKEMLPGETMWIDFPLGIEESWHVWVPK